MSQSEPATCRLFAWSDHCNFYTVDRRERIEKAIPLLPAVAADPELSGRGAEIKGRRSQLINVHRIPQHGEVAFPFGKTFRQFVPRVAAILAAPDGGSSTRTGARHGL